MAVRAVVSDEEYIMERKIMLSEQQVADLLGDIDETTMHGVE